VHFTTRNRGPVRCVAQIAFAGARQPTFPQVLLGAGFDVAPSASVAMASVPNVFIFSPLEAGTTYYIHCGASGVVASMTATTASRLTPVASDLPDVPAFFAQQPSIIIVTSNSIAVGIAVTVVAQVRCIVVFPGQKPSAFDVMQGQTQAGLPAVRAPPARRVLASGGPATFRIDQLQAATVYEVVCATDSGILSDLLGFSTAGFSLQPEPANLPTPTSFDVYLATALPEQVRCAAVLRGFLISADEVMFKSQGTDNWRQEAVWSRIKTTAPQEAMLFSLRGLSPSSNYDLYCATDSGTLSEPLSFLTADLLSAQGEDLMLAKVDGEVRATFIPLHVTLLPRAPSDNFRCVVMSVSLAEPRPAEVFRGRDPEGELFAASTRLHYIKAGERVHVELTDVPSASQLVVYCATEAGVMTPALRVETPVQIFLIEPRLHINEGLTTLTIVTATVRDEVLRCAAYRTTPATPTPTELAAGRWGGDTAFDSVSDFQRVNATVPVVIALTTLRPLTQYTIYCVTEGLARSAPLTARTAGTGSVFVSVPAEPPVGHNDRAISVEVFSTITQEVITHTLITQTIMNHTLITQTQVTHTLITHTLTAH
jgi:hypothetical protein